MTEATDKPTYLDRDAARDHIRGRGIPIGENALKDHATRGTGPEYRLINGRACYTREWLDAWIDEQASRPVRRRRARVAATEPAHITAA